MRRLTLDVGLRFQWTPPSYSQGVPLSAFDASLYNASQNPPLIQPACLDNSASLPGGDGFQSTDGTQSGYGPTGTSGPDWSFYAERRHSLPGHAHLQSQHLELTSAGRHRTALRLRVRCVRRRQDGVFAEALARAHYDRGGRNGDNRHQQFLLYLHHGPAAAENSRESITRLCLSYSRRRPI